MQVHISPGMRRITISTSPGFLDPLKMKGAARFLSYRCLFWTILSLTFFLPFVFIGTALVTLEGVHGCTSLGMGSCPGLWQAPFDVDLTDLGIQFEGYIEIICFGIGGPRSTTSFPPFVHTSECSCLSEIFLEFSLFLALLLKCFGPWLMFGLLFPSEERFTFYQLILRNSSACTLGLLISAKLQDVSVRVNVETRRIF